MAYDRGDYGRGSGRGGNYGPYGAQGSYGAGRDWRDREQRDRYYNDDDGQQGDRGFFERAGDEISSWFGDEEAARRRNQDAREEDRYSDQRRSGSQYGGGSYAGARQGQAYGGDNYQRGWQGGRAQPQSQPHHDPHYSEWRQRQIDQLDRDYEEYRRHNQSKFDTEFGGWRSNRQSQRSILERIEEHTEVVGSDGAHVGTVDKVRGDRIILTKTDQDAGGHHHSIPSSWFQSHEGGKVVISKTAEEAKRLWRDEERNSAMFGGQDRDRDAQGDGPHILNRSFSGTY